jgi:hypothetical protein
VGRASGIDLTLRLPQSRADDGAGALEIGLDHGDHQAGARRLAVDGEALQQVGIGADHRPAVDPEGRARAGDQEHQRHARVADHVAQAVDAVVAATVGQDQRALVVDADEAGLVAARAAVQALGADGGQGQERRGLDQGAIVRGDAVGDLDGRGRDRGRRVEGLERFEAVDDVIDGGHASIAAPLLGPPA